ncbi:MAG: sensor histidine kinase N-terminal domain-containing protein [Rhodoferax sp.]
MLRSVRSKLLLWVLIPLAGAIALNAVASYRDAQHTATVVQDRLLLGSARSMGEQVRYEDGAFHYQILPSALELFQLTQPDRIFYRITSGAGQLLAGYTDLIRPVDMAPGSSPHFFNARMRDMPVRVVALRQPVIGAPSDEPVLVEVAQTLEEHQQLASSLWLHAMGQQLLILALAAVFIVFGLHGGLRPLLRLRDAVRSREPGTLQLLTMDGIPVELVPLVDSLNDYIQRLEAHVGAQGVFIQNAAHQLRTPFAVLNTQLNFAARADGAEDRQESLQAARNTLREATRLVNQLLTLSMAESMVAPKNVATEAGCNVVVVVQEVFERLVGLAQTKSIELELEFDAEAAPTVGFSAVVLREILTNLVDNAIRYCPVGSHVIVRAIRSPQAMTLEVQDNGPGIPPESRVRIFERFYRMDDGRSDGSGLGLAIVQEFASKVGAGVQLDTPAHGAGLLVRLVFPIVR